MEAHIVLWHDQMESLSWFLDFNELQDFHVILEDFASERVRADVDHVDIGVFDGENSRDLRILLLFELLNSHSLHLGNRERVNVNLNSLLRLDIRPASLELFLHIAPNSPRLVVQLVHLDLGRLLQLIQSKFTLDNGGFDHEVLELCKGTVSLVTAPCLLNLDRSHDRTVWSLVLLAGILDGLVDLDTI